MSDDILSRIDEAADRSDQQEAVAHLASLVADYFYSLREQGLPMELIHLLVTDYHMVVLSHGG